ncbi:hypothetical protein NI17_023975 (plasmid) [Thermobifida halotolerans]|uniref:Uncharacterized protein n=1 Tax=Thermobifida halotolerans TaxID=483545 RepID=A0A399FTD9_9ACTN|nr:hypothetical protein [Thermobifida halotolerans]UOE22275.1 hypothetical protein NI17_023975 [Thermobifida halotolerans]
MRVVAEVVLVLLTVVCGVALPALAFFFGGVVTFHTLRLTGAGCARRPGTDPPEYSCDHMGYVIPVLLGGFLVGLVVLVVYVLLLRRFRGRPLTEATAGVLVGMLLTLAGVALFAATFYLGGKTSLTIVQNFDIVCVNSWTEPVPPENACRNTDYVTPVLFGGLVTGAVTAAAYGLGLRWLHRRKAEASPRFRQGRTVPQRRRGLRGQG